MTEKFTEGITNWQQKLGLVRDVVRQELVTRQLSEHLPPSSVQIRILDVGSGQGTQAIRLASLGYDVTGIEPSDELRAVAEKDASNVGVSAQFYKGTLEDIPAQIEQGFDVVCCHGVLMYLPDLETSLGRLVSLVRRGGLVSVLTRNRASIAMRAGMAGDWAAALKGFDERYYENRLGIKNVRADDPEEVIDSLKEQGAETVGWYGVRLFTDHWDDRQAPAGIKDLIEAEYQAGKREPYRRLTSLTHVMARRTK